ncbi:MAG: CatA-like O-acetyltransferase [Eubacteriales bacterium]|nr:CatA-like O-acetyltransferase [Eubacteriales bacterium]
MGYHYVDMEQYKRRDHFSYFQSLAFPYVGTTVQVEITGLYDLVKEKELPFFLTFCYCAARAANRIPELRQRIKEGKILEYDSCRTSHTVALEDGTYCYCTLDPSMDFREYLPYAQRAQEAAKEEASIQEEEDGALEYFFITTVPWLSYTSLIQPVPVPADSNPRISWGKYFREGDRLLMPVSILCHHGLVDGRHIGLFYELLGQEMERLEKEL